MIDDKAKERRDSPEAKTTPVFSGAANLAGPASPSPASPPNPTDRMASLIHQLDGHLRDMADDIAALRRQIRGPDRSDVCDNCGIHSTELLTICPYCNKPKVASE